MYAKKSLSWQFGPFRFLPWFNKSSEYQEDLKITSCYAGWLCLQFKWFLVD